jgi:hypothetical protein
VRKGKRVTFRYSHFCFFKAITKYCGPSKKCQIVNICETANVYPNAKAEGANIIGNGHKRKQHLLVDLEEFSFLPNVHVLLEWLCAEN